MNRSVPAVTKSSEARWGEPLHGDNLYGNARRCFRRTLRLKQSCLETSTNHALKQIPQKLVVNVVVILHFLRLDERAQQTWTTVGRSLLKIGIPALDVFPENL